MTDSIGHRIKFGVIAPSTNTSVQPEYEALRPYGVSNHFSRCVIPDTRVVDDASFMVMLNNIRAAVEPALVSVMSCSPQHVIMGMSAETFWDGLEGQKRLEKRMKKVAGVDITMGSDACRAALRAYGKGIKRLGIVTPYMPVGDKQVLRLFDVASGKNIWMKEYDSKAVPLKSTNPEWTGYVKSNGDVEILNTATGKPVSSFKLDAKLSEAHLKGCVEAQLLADSDRFYVVLDRTPAGNALAMRRNMMYNYSMRSQLVNGPIYAFERTTGKRLWYVEDLLENQWIILERFADLPVIIAAAGILFSIAGTFLVKVKEGGNPQKALNVGNLAP